MQNLDLINDPKSFLNDKSNALLVPERLRGMFEPRVAKVAGMLSKQSATKIPFLVMCGTLDPRIDISKQFASSLQAHGYEVKFQWPQTPHGGRQEYPEEFSKFCTGAVSFFVEVITK